MIFLCDYKLYERRGNIVMSIKEEKAAQLFSNGYNCSQAVISVFSEENGLEVKTAMKLANGFGGGLRCGEVCGAVTGAIMAIGLKCGFYIEGDFKQKGYCNEKSYEFIEKFKNEHNSILCRDLLNADIQCPEDHRKPEVQSVFKHICPKLVKSAVNILEEMKF